MKIPKKVAKEYWKSENDGYIGIKIKKWGDGTTYFFRCEGKRKGAR